MWGGKRVSCPEGEAVCGAARGLTRLRIEKLACAGVLGRQAAVVPSRRLDGSHDRLLEVARREIVIDPVQAEED
jgi:hypothetical protein